MKKQGDLLMSALVAGAAFGVVSGMPILGVVNCLCCAWIVGAGATACFLLIRSSQEPIDFGRAALVGTMAGLVAAPVWLVTMLAFLFLGGGNLQDRFEEAFSQSRSYLEGAEQAEAVLAALGAPILALLMLCVLSVICAPFGLAGGLLGRLIFERRTPASPVPPAAPPAAPLPPPAPSTVPPASGPQEPPPPTTPA